MKVKILLFSIIVTLMTTLVQANPTTDVGNGIDGTWQLQKNVAGSVAPAVYSPELFSFSIDRNSNEITINEGFKEFIRTLTLPMDGTAVTKNIFEIGKVSAKAFWKGRVLHVQTVTEKGDKITETFELSANKKQLFMTVEVLKMGEAKTLKARRVFNRVAENNRNRTAQIGIADYPF